MADDDTPDVDEEVFNIDTSDEIGEEFEVEESIEVLAESEDDEEDDDVESPPRPAKSKSDEEDDEEDDDVEADLGEILKDRIAAGDDEDEDEPQKPARSTTNIAPKRADEWTCEQCFFIVSKNQFGTRDNPRCPQGEEPCPSIVRAFS